MPKSGYINALDFKSPKDLAKYLKYLDSNKTAYNSFFKWKKYANFDYEKPILFSPLCDMCIYLHLEDFYGIKQKIYHNMNEYWNKENDCVLKKYF